MKSEVRRARKPSRQIVAVDLFCGAGGMTYGLNKAGIQVAAGFDLDPACRYAYEANNRAEFVESDIRSVHRDDILRYYPKKAITVLVGCAPCQPFSSHANKRRDREHDAKWNLLTEFGRLIRSVVPDIVSMENVPQILAQDVFREFESVLISLSYHVWRKVVFCPRYGIPQRRSRLVLLASRLGPISLLPQTHTVAEYPTVRSVIGEDKVEVLEAGGVSRKDTLHRASTMSPLNIERIRQSRPGGTWRDWDESLLTNCHRKPTGATYRSVYGRMEWDSPSPTITTQFFRFGTGRFGHPDQDRALSIREGALLQTFPLKYKFLKRGDPVLFSNLGILIGNAVPIELARVIGMSIRNHIERYEE
jgi:DNA (cytosine-5)-methyltransferase 1